MSAEGLHLSRSVESCLNSLRAVHCASKELCLSCSGSFIRRGLFRSTHIRPHHQVSLSSGLCIRRGLFRSTHIRPYHQVSLSSGLYIRRGLFRSRTLGRVIELLYHRIYASGKLAVFQGAARYTSVTRDVS